MLTDLLLIPSGLPGVYHSTMTPLLKGGQGRTTKDMEDGCCVTFWLLVALVILFSILFAMQLAAPSTELIK